MIDKKSILDAYNYRHACKLFDAEKTIMADEFGVDTDEFGVACMVAFGYRADEQRPKTRQNIDDITQWFS